MRSSKSRGEHYLQCATKYVAKGACEGAFISVKKLESIVIDELNRMTREFLDKVSQTGVYGFLNEEGITMNWKEWTLRLMAQARMTSWNGAMTRYFSLIGSRPNQNYLGAFIPVSEAFYAKGVRDYVDNRQQFDYALFQEKTRVFLTAKGFQNVNNRRYIDEIQLCCFDLQRRDNAVWESKTPYEANKLGAMKPMQFDWYIRAVGLALITNKN